ncbi:MAG: folylpolyglutamate synthase/dihydrofolate synthase family protein [Planctomycetota bacterium]
MNILDKLVNYEKTPGGLSPRAMGLERVIELSRRFNDPWRDYPTLHIAGTKGKGSTCSFAAAMLAAAGYRTGLYLSPHVLDVRERIQINGQWVSETRFNAALDELAPVLEAIIADKTQRRPSYFEAITHAAFRIFQMENVDVAVIETGLGGRLDATNIILPKACAITPISYDHQSVLGYTIPEIAFEKAGIIKPGVPLVIGRQPDEAYAVIRSTAESKRAPITDFAAAERALPTVIADALPKNFAGAHQRDNLAVAWSLVCAAGYNLPPETAAEGVRSVDLPARCQIIQPKPQFGAGKWLVDGAHNLISATALADTLKTQFNQSRPLVFVIGCASNKTMTDIMRPLADLLPDTVILTQYPSDRSASVETLLDAWRQVSSIKPELIQDCDSAFETGAALISGKPSGLLCVTGSLYLAGDFIRWTQQA